MASNDQKQVPLTFFDIQNKSNLRRYKSKLQMMLMGLVISISGIMFGYGLTEISTINIKVLIDEYHIPMSPSLTQSLLIGILPFGGIFGSLGFYIVIKYFRRRQSIYFSTVMMVISVIIIQIKTVETLFIGRFLQGICIGIFVSIAPIYLRQIGAKQLKHQIMALFSMGKILGIVIAYAIQNILQAVDFQYSFRILLAFDGVLGIIQALLIFFFISDSPYEMVKYQQYDGARKIIQQLYSAEYVDEVMEEIKLDVLAEKDKQNIKSQKLEMTQNKKSALIMAINISLLRQFIGGNVLVTFSGQIIAVFPHMQTAAKYTALIINCIQLLSNSVSLFTIANVLGRRPILIFGCIGLTLANFAIAFSLLFELQIMILVMMSIYMLIYGGSFLPVGWSYPSEIIPAEQAVWTNLANWIGTWIVVSIPPIVVGAMPHNNAYPLFFVFGAYGLVSCIYIYKRMIESKNRTYEEIIKDY